MKYVSALLRAAIAFAFLYPALDSLFRGPGPWYGFFPAEIVAVVPVPIEMLVVGFAVFEILVAAAVLFTRSPVWPATVAGIVLLLITFFNLHSFEIVFRDVSLALAAFALALLHRRP